MNKRPDLFLLEGLPDRANRRRDFSGLREWRRLGRRPVGRGKRGAVSRSDVFGSQLNVQ